MARRRPGDLTLLASSKENMARRRARAARSVTTLLTREHEVGYVPDPVWDALTTSPTAKVLP